MKRIAFVFLAILICVQSAVPAAAEVDEATIKAVTATALDYMDGAHSGDAARVEKAIHPELTKVWPRPVQQTGRTMLQKIGASYLIEMTGTGSGKLDEGKRNISMTVFDYGDDIAMVEALSAMFHDYIQLAKINGEWKIVNVLWVMNPDAPKSDR